MEPAFQSYKSLLIKKVKYLIYKKKYEYDIGVCLGEISKTYYYEYKFKNLINYRMKDSEVEIKNNNNFLKKNYCVFLDENFVEHPDIKFANNSHNLFWPKKDIYYAELVDFFDKLEKKYNLKVIIAAHPTTKKNSFKSYKMYFEKTKSLVENSKFCILHQSSSINFSILSKKKMLFITTDEIEKCYLKKQIFELANYFNVKPLNISKNLR